jgi:hypothetical protein
MFVEGRVRVHNVEPCLRNRTKNVGSVRSGTSVVKHVDPLFIGLVSFVGDIEQGGVPGRNIDGVWHGTFETTPYRKACEPFYVIIRQPPRMLLKLVDNCIVPNLAPLRSYVRNVGSKQNRTRVDRDLAQVSNGVAV